MEYYWKNLRNVFGESCDTNIVFEKHFYNKFYPLLWVVFKTVIIISVDLAEKLYITKSDFCKYNKWNSVVE